MEPELEEERTCNPTSVLEWKELQDLVDAVVETRGQTAAQLHHSFAQILGRYQEQPQLLDGLLAGLAGPLTELLDRLVREQPVDRQQVTAVSRWIWTLATVRGWKVVSRFVPSHPSCIEPVVLLMESLHDLNGPTLGYQSSDSKQVDYEHIWELECVLLMWLTVLVLLPFDLSSLDSRETEKEEQGMAGKTEVLYGSDLDTSALSPLPASIFKLCAFRLGVPSRARDMAAQVLGRLVTRPDTKIALNLLGSWAQTALLSALDETVNSSFLTMGIAAALAVALKTGDRASLEAFALRLLPLVEGLCSNEGRTTQGKARVGMKLAQRIALALLERTNSSATGDCTLSLQQHHDDAISTIESLLDVLLNGLAHRDTLVRWSAAKGVGRLAGRLPFGLAYQVLDGVLEVGFGDASNDAAWHGGCLALAELARRHKLPHGKAEELVASVLLPALRYEVRRGACGVGTHVRDAAAYTCWALARSPDGPPGKIVRDSLGPALLTLACLDREVNCRRAGAAAFQELVGRCGGWEDGIALLRIADYFSVSNRQKAYLTVAPCVAAYRGFFLPIANQLLEDKLLRHWEKSTRELAARAIAALSPIDEFRDWVFQVALPRLLGEATAPEVEARHGAIAGLAELLTILGCHDDKGSENIPPHTWDAVARQQLVTLLPRLDSARLNRGKGGEILRTALCRYVATLSSTGIIKEQAHFDAMEETVLNSLRCSADDAQTAAVEAIAPLNLAKSTLCVQEIVADTEKTEKDTLTNFPKQDSSSCIAWRLVEEILQHPGAADFERRGAIRGLGVLPWGAYKDDLEAWSSILDILLTIADPENRQEPSVEVRTAAVTSLAAQAATQHALAQQKDEPVHEQYRRPTSSVPGVPQHRIPTEIDLLGPALTACLAALKDYTTDNRGDIGSWAREAALVALEMLFPAVRNAVITDKHSTGSNEISLLVEQVTAAVCQQSMERIDRLRASARRCLRHYWPLLMEKTVEDGSSPSSAEQQQEDRVMTILTNESEEHGPSDLAALGAALLSERASNPSCLRSTIVGLTYAIGSRDADAAGQATHALVEASNLMDRPATDDSTSSSLLGSIFLTIWDEEKERARQRQQEKRDAGLLVGQTSPNSSTSFPKAIPIAQPTTHSQRLLGVPLLVTAEVLLSRTPLKSHIAFVTGIASRAVAEASLRISDIARLQSLAALLGCLAVPLVEDEERTNLVKTAARQGLVRLIRSRFPAVRRSAAEHMYLSLLACEMNDEELLLVDLLAGTDWGTPETEALVHQVAHGLSLE